MKVKAEAMHQRERHSNGHSADVKKDLMVDRIMRYATGINRFYWLSCCILIFVLTGLVYSLYPEVSMIFVVISLSFGFGCWVVIWLSIIMQIKMWNKAINQIHAG